MYPEECPKCHANLLGEEIPEHLREGYKPPYRYHRVIGVYDLSQDRTVLWLCPDCGHEWERKMMSSRYPEECPKCHANLLGEEVPEHLREGYKPPYRYYRVIGLYDLSQDRTVLWLCPDCGHEWERK